MYLINFAGIPRVDKLEIEGRGFHTNLYAVRGTYSGGKEGKSRIQWLRSMVGSPDLISIQGKLETLSTNIVPDSLASPAKFTFISKESCVFFYFLFFYFCDLQGRSDGCTKQMWMTWGTGLWPSTPP